MKGYFGIGVEGISKPMNVGAVLRTAHAFGASFVFTVDRQTDQVDFGWSNTSSTENAVPYYDFADAEALTLPRGCVLVGIELMDDSIDLPSFRHPRQAAYVLGSERFGLSPGMAARCAHVVKIPTRFSINLSLAGALVMYDRVLTLGRFAPRPVRSGGPTEALPDHVQGALVRRSARTGPEDPDVDGSAVPPARLPR